MENNNVQDQKSFPFFSLIYKNLLLVIMIVVLSTLMFLGYALIRVKPVYSVSRSFILRMAVIGESNESSNATVGRRYISQIEGLLKTPDYIIAANEKYEGEVGKISANSIHVDYNSDSLIFSLSYSDIDKNAAMEKLQAVYLVACEKLQEDINVASLKLIDTDNIVIDSATNTYQGIDVSVDNGLTKWILYGAVAGVFVAVMVILILYAIDNTIHSKEELEEITGASVLAFVEKID